MCVKIVIKHEHFYKIHSLFDILFEYIHLN